MPLAELARRVTFFLRRDRIAADLAEEMRLHVELRAARERAGGASEAEAAYRARRVFGNAARHVEESRDQWRLRWLDELATDLKFGIRALHRAPAATAIVVVTLAVGIGATLATFTIMDAALFRPLPVREPERLVVLPRGDVPMVGSDDRPSPVGYEALRARTDVYAGFGAYAAGGLNLTDGVQPVRVQVGLVTPSVLRLLGVAPAMGRHFTEDEGVPGGPDVLILSDRLWRSQFGADPAVLGRRVALHDRAYEVVGVMPPRFAFPEGSDLWIPMPVPLTTERAQIFRFLVATDFVARLAPGVTRAQADSHFVAPMRATGWTPAPGEPMPEIHRPLRRHFVGDGERRLATVTALAGLLLAAACANVCGLLLVRWSSRRREIAVRTAVGAGRGRIVRQLATESVVLAAFGAVGGLGVAVVALRTFDALMPPGLAALVPPVLDARALVALLALALVSTIGIGALPAFLASRGDVTRVLKSGGVSATRRVGGGRLGGALVVTEVALAVVLLVGSGLLAKSLANLYSSDTGIRVDGVVTARIALSDAKYPDAPDRRRFYARLEEELREDAAFERTGLVGALPLRGEWHPSVMFDLLDRSALPESPSAEFVPATADYFAALGIPLLAGRTFVAADSVEAARGAIVSASLARRWWPDGSPLGARVSTGAGEATIVGVVGDVHGTALDEEQKPQLYLPHAGLARPQTTIVARSRLPAGEALARVRAAVARVDPAQVVYDMKPMEQVAAEAVAEQRTTSALATVFGAITLLLAALGLYGLLAFGVAQRTPEMGIRVALGARRVQVVRAAVADGLLLALVGVALGLGASYAAVGWLRPQLHGVEPTDPVVFAVVPAVLLATALVAALRPALRAARVDPMRVLRAE